MPNRTHTRQFKILTYLLEMLHLEVLRIQSRSVLAANFECMCQYGSSYFRLLVSLDGIETQLPEGRLPLSPKVEC
jgi:hypothetical protein